MARSRLEQLLVPVQEKILTRIAGCSFRVGAQFIPDQTTAPPRVVWARTVDRYGPPDGPGGNPRPLLTKEASIIAHCWAVGTGDPNNEADPNATPDKAIEDLQDTVAWALRLVLGVAVVPLNGEHLRDSVGAAGQACLLAFSVAQPISDNTLPTVQPTTTAADSSGASLTDRELSCGEGSP